MQTSMTQHAEYKGPLIYLMVGACLLSLNVTLPVVLNTIFGYSDTFAALGTTLNYGSLGTGAQLFGYNVNGSLSAQWTTFTNSLILLIQFIGFLSFVRGWFLIAKTAEGQSQQASVGKGMTHIIGGVIAINFVNVVNIFKLTAGITV